MIMDAAIKDLNFFKFLGHMRFGTCELKEDNKIILTVGCREMDIANITEEDIKWLDQHLEVAYYSENNVKTTNVNVRNSKYTKAFLLNLNVDKILLNMGISGFAKPYKLNLYKGGSFFSTHRDTNRPGFVGTLILILPTEYSGGELCFGDFNAEAYQLQHDEKARSNNVRFIFFDGELEHSVSEVLSGNRITLIYNVFQSETLAKQYDPNVSFTVIPNEWIDEVIKHACEFCQDKTNILMGDLSYRNEVFYKILGALKDKLEVIEIAVENELEVREITEVHKLKEIDDDVSVGSGALDYDGLIEQTYKVEHVLFASYSELDKYSQSYTRRYGYRGNSPFESEEELTYYTGFLINPMPKQQSENVASTEDTNG